MTRLSDEEIIESYFTEEKLERFRGLDELVKKAIALDVIGGVRLADSIYIPQIEKLQGEIESLSQSNLSLKQLVKDIAEYSIEEIARLTAKHERLVKGLKEIQTETVFDLIGNRQQAITYQTLMFFLTKEGNV